MLHTVPTGTFNCLALKAHTGKFLYGYAIVTIAKPNGHSWHSLYMLKSQFMDRMLSKASDGALHKNPRVTKKVTDKDEAEM